jgi:class 3 adenylate cyclase
VRFDPSILGLGDVSKPAVAADAICAMFDLGGFTAFAGQVDPHLAIPEFLSAFLPWLFDTLKTQSTLKEVDNGVILYNRLPFFAKFMGDGVLLLWDTRDMDETAAFNIPVTCWNICVRYKTHFLPRVRLDVTDPPSELRVGVARGRVFSVGDGSDFVGPCINVAARLQKISAGTTICFSRLGFNGEKYAGETTKGLLVLKKVMVRGVGYQLVYLPKSEFENLSAEDQKAFRAP